MRRIPTKEVSPRRGLMAGAVQRFVVMVLGLIFSWLTSQSDSGAGEQHLLPTNAPAATLLTNLEAALNLPLAEAQRGCRLKARVTVTYCHPQWGMLFVLGESLGTFIRVTPSTPPLRPGDVIEVEGATSASRGYAEVKLERLQLTGQRRTLGPRSRSLESILSGQASCEWVEIEGRVLAAYGKEGRTILQLMVGSTNLPVFLLHGKVEQARRWVDARAKVRGVVSVLYDAQGKMTGVAVLAQEPEQVQVLQLADTNPLDLPLTPIDQLRGPTAAKPSERVHVEGALERLQSDLVAWVRDRTAAIRVQCRFKPDERLEASVEVLGYPVLTNGEIVLCDAVVLPLVAPMTPGSDMAPEPSSSTNSLPLVETAGAVHRLSRSEAARGYPVRLEGVVTYSDPLWWMLFVQDETDGIFVAPLTSQMEVRPGQRVVVNGTTAAGDFAPTVTRATFTILGNAPMPTPAQPTLGELLTGQFDCRWVKISGTVQSSSNDDGLSILCVRTRGGAITVILSPTIPTAEAERLVNARVTLCGAIGVVLNRLGQLVAVRLHVPDLDSVHVDEQPPTDPFALSTESIGELLRYRPDEDVGRRIKIAGIITSVRLDGTVSLQDGSGGMLLRMQFRQALPRLGDRVEMVGYSTIGSFSPTLVDARLRILEPGTEVAATNATPEEILGGLHPSELVKVNARLVEDAFFRPGGSLVLQSGSVVFEASLPPSLERSDAERLAAGSQRAVTGVCEVQGGLGNQPRSFRLLLRRPEDVQLLVRPPWWNLRRLGWVVTGIGAVGFLTLVWNLLLAKKNRQLHESEERARSILNNVQAGIIVIDPVSRQVLDANPVALSLLKRNQEEVVGQVCHNHVCPADRGGCPVLDLGETVNNSEGVLVRADGVHAPILKTVVPIMLGGRRVLLESFVDITERRHAQTELEKAKLAAEAASEAKSRFLAMMSHEIRTPLNGVTGMLHLLLRDRPTARQRHWIDMAQSSADTLLRVINDILDFSKVEAGKLDLRDAPTLLHITIGKTAAAFAHKAAGKGLAWSLYLDPAVPSVVETDSDRLAQVLGNLLGNAVKFTDAGSVGLRVTLQADTSEAAWVRFEVTDTGMGVSSEQQERLFKPFSQVDNSTTRRHGGTGLGLGICKELVELMGGRIGLESAAGKGSTFWFELPFKKTTLVPASPIAPADATSGGASGRLPEAGARRVLLAEDNEINQELAREMIQFAGCECDCVADGEEVVRAAASGRYDLVFMDCMMPGMDGYEATRAIRAEEAREAAAGRGKGRLPIIAMTANAMAGDQEECLAAGMDDYLSKPLDPEDVARVISMWPTRQHPGHELAVHGNGAVEPDEGIPSHTHSQTK
jgi:PAS domain S-box-containing protein